MRSKLILNRCIAMTIPANTSLCEVNPCRLSLKPEPDQSTFKRKVQVEPCLKWFLVIFIRPFALPLVKNVITVRARNRGGARE